MVDGSNTDSLVDRKNSDPLGSESIQYSIQDRCVLYQSVCILVCVLNAQLLERILYIWAIRHPASGYVQGINDLVTPFFVVFLSEYLPDGQLLQLCCYQWSEAFMEHLNSEITVTCTDAAFGLSIDELIAVRSQYGIWSKDISTDRVKFSVWSAFEQ